MRKMREKKNGSRILGCAQYIIGIRGLQKIAPKKVRSAH